MATPRAGDNPVTPAERYAAEAKAHTVVALPDSETQLQTLWRENGELRKEVERLKRGIEEEREACASLAESLDKPPLIHPIQLLRTETCQEIAAAIRARGNT